MPQNEPYKSWIAKELDIDVSSLHLTDAYCDFWDQPRGIVYRSSSKYCLIAITTKCIVCKLSDNSAWQKASDLGFNSPEFIAFQEQEAKITRSQDLEGHL